MSERILVIDDDEGVAGLVADALAVVHFDITVAATPDEAIVAAKNSRFKLVICDVDLPGMNGFQCRDRIRQIPRYGEIPFLFTTAAHTSVEVEIARNLRNDKLLLKPFQPAELRRTVFALLEPEQVERGPLPSALVPILERVASAAESGVLTLVQGQKIKRVVMQGGRIVFAASNDPRDLIGQALLRTGWIKEADLLEAFSSSGVTADTAGKPFLAAALTAMKRLTSEQAESAFVGKIRESVLDVFLWFDGMAEYVAGEIESSDTPFVVAIDVADLRKEGERRREKWRRVIQTLPDTAVTFKLALPAWPPDMLTNPGDKLLVQLIEKGFSMAQILVELRGQDYAVGVRLGSLVLKKIIKITPPQGFRPLKPPKADTVADGQTLQIQDDSYRGPGVINPEDALAGATVPDENELLARMRGATPPPFPGLPASEGSLPIGKSEADAQPAAAAVILERGLEAFRAGDMVRARAAFEEVLARDPLNALARQRIGEVDSANAASARAEGLTNDAKVGLAKPGAIDRSVAPNEAFVLNRLASGPRAIGELLRLSPLTERELLATLQRLVKQGIIKKS